MPVDRIMLRYLAAQDAIDGETDLDAAQRFLETQLKADELWGAFTSIRQAALEAGIRGRKAAAPRAKGPKRRAAGTQAAAAAPKRPRSQKQL